MRTNDQSDHQNHDAEQVQPHRASDDHQTHDVEQVQRNDQSDHQNHDEGRQLRDASAYQMSEWSDPYVAPAGMSPQGRSMARHLALGRP